MCEMCGMIDIGKCSGNLCHLDVSQIKKIEVDLKKVMAVNSNIANPWKIAYKDRLYYLALGYPVSKK